MTLRDDDLDPALSALDRRELERIARRLTEERPLPSAMFRGRLRRELVRQPAYSQRRLRWTRRAAAAAITTGTALFAVVAAGLTGAGPLAPTSAENPIAQLLSRFLTG